MFYPNDAVTNANAKYKKNWFSLIFFIWQQDTTIFYKQNMSVPTIKSRQNMSENECD